MRLLLLTRYEDQGASSRLRALQYAPLLQADGIDITIAPLLSNAYLAGLYRSGRRSAAEMARAYLQRAVRLLSAGDYDVIWVEKELFPMLPAWAERLIRRPLVVDYDDAIFHTYDRHPRRLIRRALGGKIDAVMRRAALVIACNPYLAERARSAGARRVELLPTVVDLARYPLIERPAPPDGVIRVGWIGTPVTAKYLTQIQPALAQVCDGKRARLVVIGAEEVRLPGVVVEGRRWSAETEAADLAQIDIGIMPLVDDEWERGKCGYKLIQYMASGRAVMASPVGVNSEIVQDGVNGLLAGSLEAWRAGLERLCADDDLRARLGMAGRARVEAAYQLAVTAPRLAGLLREMV